MLYASNQCVNILPWPVAQFQYNFTKMFFLSPFTQIAKTVLLC